MVYTPVSAPNWLQVEFVVNTIKLRTLETPPTGGYRAQFVFLKVIATLDEYMLQDSFLIPLNLILIERPDVKVSWK